MPKRWCIGCGKLYDRATTPNLRCPACQPAATTTRNTKASTTARGYGSTYQRNRAIIVSQALAAADSGQPVTCWLCPRPLLRGQKITAEHKIPRRKGGSSELSNLAAAHAGCNYGWRRKRSAIR